MVVVIYSVHVLMTTSLGGLVGWWAGGLVGCATNDVISFELHLHRDGKFSWSTMSITSSISTSRLRLDGI